MNETELAAAGAGLTTALIAVLYTVAKLLKRSRCASHTKCCDMDISRAETERKENINEIVKQLVLEIRKEKLEAVSSGEI